MHADQLVEELRLHQLQAGLEQFGADRRGSSAPPTKNMISENVRYIVPMSLWFVVVSQRSRPLG